MAGRRSTWGPSSLVLSEGSGGSVTTGSSEPKVALRPARIPNLFKNISPALSFLSGATRVGVSTPSVLLHARSVTRISAPSSGRVREWGRVRAGDQSRRSRPPQPPIGLRTRLKSQISSPGCHRTSSRAPESHSRSRDFGPCMPRPILCTLPRCLNRSVSKNSQRGIRWSQKPGRKEAPAQ